MNVRLSYLALALLAGVAGAQDRQVLQDFEAADLAGAYKTNGTTAEVVAGDGGKALKVTSGTNNPYPNILINPPSGSWDLSRYKQVELDVTNLSPESIRIGMRVDNTGATGRKNSNQGGVTLDPGEKGTIVVDMYRDVSGGLAEKLQGMHHTPWGPRGDLGGPIDPAKVIQVNVFLNRPDRSYTFQIDNLRATGVYDPAADKVPSPFFPFVDTYGQYIHQDWPGKVKADTDLVAEKELEAKSIHDSPRPADWNQYGGWAAGPKLQSTGHFTTAKHEGKWHLVDPDGRLFFSLGMCVVKPGGTTVTDNRDGWFQNPPWENPQFSKYAGQGKTVLRGDYKGQTPKVFDFFGANAQRKYGDDWQKQWSELIPRRLMNWGFNTLGNWSEPDLFQTTTIPYTHWIFNDGPKLPWRQGVRNRIPDPWNPKLADVILRRGRTMTKGTVDDPKCIGYFVDNEVSWGTETAIAETTMLGDGESAAKVEFTNDLKAKYGTIEKLNDAWRTEYESWEKLLAEKPQGVKDLPKGKAVDADFLAFSEKTARKYFETVRKCVKELAPNKLYLGCRFAEYNPMVVRIAAEYCDVVSFNLYRETIAGWVPPGGIDKPVIVGEFHFGARDRGVFGDGLKGAATTPERAKMFQRYVGGAARNPFIVGVHWFQLCDEPAIGRVQDGENHNIGFLTITDRPYAELIEASRAVAKDLYTLRTEKAAAAK